MSYCGFTWYLKYQGTNNIEEELEELIEGLQATSTDKWNLEIVKYTTNTTQFMSNAGTDQEVFLIKNSLFQSQIVVQLTTKQKSMWEFEGDFTHLSKTLNIKQESRMTISGRVYQFGDFRISIGDITKESSKLKDKLVRLEFLPLNKFNSNFEIYKSICKDFFSAVSPTLFTILKVDMTVDSSHEFLQTIANQFKLSEGEKFLFTQRKSALILLNIFQHLN